MRLTANTGSSTAGGDGGGDVCPRVDTFNRVDAVDTKNPYRTGIY